MSDSPLDRIPAYNRVSIRAVLVHGEEDPGSALAAAGIVEAIAIPVVMGEDIDLPGGLLGDGITPNLMAVLETEQPDDFDPSPNMATSQPAAAAFGTRSPSPTSRLGGPQSGRFGDGAEDFPPSPGRSSEIDRLLTSGWKKPPPYAGFDPLKFAGLRGVVGRGNPELAGQGTANGAEVTPAQAGNGPARNTESGLASNDSLHPTDGAGPALNAGQGDKENDRQDLTSRSGSSRETDSSHPLIKAVDNLLQDINPIGTAEAAGTDNKLEPDPDATGPHSTYRVAPDGTIQH